MPQTEIDSRLNGFGGAGPAAVAERERWERGGGESRRAPAAVPRPAGGRSVADSLAPLVEGLFGDRLRIRFEFWDGSAIGPADSVGVIRMTSKDAIRRVLWRPDELGLGRAFVAGDLDVNGDFFELLMAFRDATSAGQLSRVRGGRLALAAARDLDIVERPLPPPPEEARLSGWRHSLRRDSKAISHHYDVGNDFFELVLGPTMTYSCARFTDPGMTLEDAQAAKYELICRKLGLHERPGSRLLDVGCGWGSMAIHAAARHDAQVVGITISEAQADRARQRAAAAGLSDRVTIRLQDYRRLAGETFDAISSIGMSEHVGRDKLGRYFDGLRDVLAPTGRMLNHAISSVGGSKVPPNSFMGRYVFPDADLIDVGEVVLAMERAGFEVRDVESLREHYATTLRAWIANLEDQWDRAVELVGEARARVWRLYMAGSAVGFEDGGIALHQVLGIVPEATGVSQMPASRRGWDDAADRSG